ncbi:cytochrome c oxidase subunit 3 [Haloplanus aerogenes]|uniref:Cytochrome c oxidase subunit 3 n=1 Tax=Haloplanus aerogenes TaxID=660522 RepID=A0A3M0CUE0_9EURY|nr:heme-copper oxidase subunit III [Haloplanus aerogenes]RMB12595.1 cytochrome c oxidase subunit 3 [Haloplanus aerogenes]
MTAVEHGGDHAEGEHTSRWPLVTAVGAAALYVGAGLALVGLDLVPVVLPAILVAVGALGFVGGLAGWMAEAFLADYWTEREGREDIYTGGMVLFLVSDVATFLAGFVYYAFIRVGTWPPTDLPPLLGSLVVVNTLILVASSLTLHYGHGALEDGNRRGFLAGLGVTTLLGVVFLGGQALEYYEFVVHENFTLAGGVFATAFYGLTGLHGLHVTLGVVLLGITLARALRGQYGPDRDTSIRTVSLYWHFVDVVWVLLVVVLYVGAVVG